MNVLTIHNWLYLSVDYVAVSIRDLVHCFYDESNTGWPLSRRREIPWQFPDGLWHSWCYVLPMHILLNIGMDVITQLTVNSCRQLFPAKILPDISLIFSKIPNSSLTADKICDISRFSRQVVTFKILFRLHSGDSIIEQHQNIWRERVFSGRPHLWWPSDASTGASVRSTWCRPAVVSFISDRQNISGHLRR